MLLIFIIWGSYSCKTENSNQTNTTELKSLTIGSYFQAVDYAPFLVAKKKGWFDDIFKDEGIEVTYVTFEDLAVINDAFLKDKLDVVFEAEPPAIVSEAANVGIDVLDISCSLVQEILVGTNSNLKNVSDLKGKKVAVLSGTSSHYGVLHLLEQANIELSDVEIIDLAPLDAKVAFESGQIDAWAVWPPFVEQQELNGKGRVLPNGDVYIHSIMAVREDLVRDYPEIYSQIDEVFDRSKEWIIKNPSEAIRIVAEALNMDEAIIEKAWPRHDWSVNLNKAILSDIQNKADFLSSEKKINSALNVSEKLIPLSALSE